jgi:hypothetical protein
MTDRGGYRAEFWRALNLLAEAFSIARGEGAALPVVVGGAAVEYHTASAVQSADFDLVGGDDAAILGALEAVGFRRTVPGSLRNLVHPDLLIAVDFVSGSLFDGRTDRSRIVLAEINEAGDRTVPFPPAEDMIADRLAQYESAPAGVPEMLEQARLLLRLAPKIDEDYLRRRVTEECSTVDLLALLQEPPRSASRSRRRSAS